MIDVTGDVTNISAAVTTVSLRVTVYDSANMVLGTAEDPFFSVSQGTTRAFKLTIFFPPQGSKPDHFVLYANDVQIYPSTPTLTPTPVPPGAGPFNVANVNLVSSTGGYSIDVMGEVTNISASVTTVRLRATVYDSANMVLGTAEDPFFSVSQGTTRAFKLTVFFPPQGSKPDHFVLYANDVQIYP